MRATALGLKAKSLRVAYQGETVTVARVEDLRIKGTHNVSNALAASAAVLAAGVGVEAVRQGLQTFAPLEHRLEPCGEIAGVAFVNDSKATNVDATLKALSAFPQGRAIVLLGGHDKGTDLSDLVAACEQDCKAVVCFGAASLLASPRHSKAALCRAKSAATWKTLLTPPFRWRAKAITWCFRPHAHRLTNSIRSNIAARCSSILLNFALSARSRNVMPLGTQCRRLSFSGGL